MVRLFLARSCLSFLLPLFLGFQIGTAAAAQITVSWEDNSVNEDGFKVERKIGPLGTYALFTTTNANVTTVRDTTLTAGIRYCYRVYAYNSIGNSAYSNEACGLPDVLASTVSLTAPAAGAIVAGTATLKASASDASGVAGMQFSLDGVNLGNEVTTAPYSISWDTTTAPNGSHTLRAIAHNTVGEKTLSAGVVVTVSNQPTPPPTAGLALAYSFDEGRGTTVADSSGHNRTGVVEGAPWTGGKDGKALAFNGGTAKVISGLRAHATMRSYLVWTKRTGPGGGNFGRIFDKRTKGAEVELLYNDEAARTYRFSRVWSGGVGDWAIPQPSANVWHHIAVVYDASSAANAPQIYVDGIAQVVTQASAPRGTPLTNTNPYIIGNRGTGDRGWNGVLDSVRIYHMALTAARIRTTMMTEVSTTTAALAALNGTEAALESSTPTTLTDTAPTTSTVPIAATVAYNFDEGTGMTVADLSGNNWNGTVAGASWTTAGMYNNALSFDGGTAKVTSGLNIHATVRSYLFWTNRSGAEGGNFGRIFDKRTDGHEVELLYNDEEGGVYRYVRVWSGRVGRWTIPQPSADVWHHIAVVYDASSAANAPQIYVDGIAQVVTQESTPRGTPLTNTDPYVIGNRGTGDQGWSGMLDELQIYDAALTAAQIQTAMTTANAAPSSALTAQDGMLGTTAAATTRSQTIWVLSETTLSWTTLKIMA